MPTIRTEAVSSTVSALCFKLNETRFHGSDSRKGDRFLFPGNLIRVAKLRRLPRFGSLPGVC